MEDDTLVLSESEVSHVTDEEPVRCVEERVTDSSLVRLSLGFVLLEILVPENDYEEE